MKARFASLLVCAITSAFAGLGAADGGVESAHACAPDGAIADESKCMAAAPKKHAQDAEFQRLICAGTTAFWDACLKGDNAAKSWLLEGGYAELLGMQATFERKVPEATKK